MARKRKTSIERAFSFGVGRDFYELSILSNHSSSKKNVKTQNLKVLQKYLGTKYSEAYLFAQAKLAKQYIQLVQTPTKVVKTLTKKRYNILLSQIPRDSFKKLEKHTKPTKKVKKSSKIVKKSTPKISPGISPVKIPSPKVSIGRFKQLDLGKGVDKLYNSKGLYYRTPFNIGGTNFNPFKKILQTRLNNIALMRSLNVKRVSIKVLIKDSNGTEYWRTVVNQANPYGAVVNHFSRNIRRIALYEQTNAIYKSGIDRIDIDRFVVVSVHYYT